MKRPVSNKPVNNADGVIVNIVNLEQSSDNNDESAANNTGVGVYDKVYNCKYLFSLSIFC